MKSFKDLRQLTEKKSLKKACWDGYEAIGMKNKDGRQVPNCVPIKEEDEKKPYKGFKKGKNHPEGGLSRAEAKRQGIHAGVETKRAAEKAGGFGKIKGKTAKRRKSFCKRMCGHKRENTSPETASDPESKINAALRVWGCRC